MEFKYKDFTVYAQGMNSFGDQQVTYFDKDSKKVFEVVNSEGSWDDARMFKLVINDLIKKTKETK